MPDGIRRRRKQFRGAVRCARGGMLVCVRALQGRRGLLFRGFRQRCRSQSLRRRAAGRLAAFADFRGTRLWELTFAFFKPKSEQKEKHYEYGHLHPDHR